MPAHRVWIDWASPCLPIAAAWLLDHAPTAGSSGGAKDAIFLDLTQVVCILPGRRPGRLLLEELIRQASARGIRLIPPRIITPGVLPALARERFSGFGTPVLPPASAQESVLAWLAVLRECSSAELAVLAPHPPAPDDILAWHDLAQAIDDLHGELSGELRGFTDAADQASVLGMDRESERWTTLARLHRSFIRTLNRAGLNDPFFLPQDWSHVVSPRSVRIISIAVTDLNARQRSIISALDAQPIVIVHGPETLSDRFDDLGCVIPAAWADAFIDVPSDRIVICDRPEDQARAVMEALADLEGRFAADEITIGLGDETLASVIRRHAAWAEVGVHAAAGTPLRQTAPCLLLQAITAWLAEPRFVALATLLRHPEFERCVSQRLGTQDELGEAVSDWLTLLDAYFVDHLHERLTGEWLGNTERLARLSAAYDAVNRVLNPLMEAPKERPLRDWCQPILSVLASIHRSSEEAACLSRETLDALLTLRDLLESLASVAADLQPRVDAAGALCLLLSHAATLAVSDEPRPGRIEMLGWLELHLDPAPVLIIAGVNDGHIPKAVLGDAFLPDGLRSRLGLVNNERRYARDSCLLQAILHSRGDVTLIAGRHSAEGEPLAPSRLLLACDDRTLVQRVLEMCEEQAEGDAPSLPAGFDADEFAEPSRFVVPSLPSDLPVPEAMGVTWFKEYLECPYRFALRRLLKLKSFTDDALELDPLGFGSLAHDVLCAFGRERTVADSVKPGEIESFLIESLRVHARRKFGEKPMPAVRVQLIRLEQRLRAFAEKQARHRAQGWIIRHCELKFSDATMLDIPDQPPMKIFGQIDRIDRHESPDGDWLIIDYKTGESGDSPFQAHHGASKPSNEWLDLQLPLYRYLAQQHDIIGGIQLAYFVLPRRIEKVNLLLAEWTIPQLDHAIEIAREVVRNIRARRFPRSLEPRSTFDEFSRICQTGAFGVEDESGADAIEADNS